MNDQIYQLLNECVAALTESVDTGRDAVYVTMDRSKHAKVLAKIALVKKEIIRDNTKEW